MDGGSKAVSCRWEGLDALRWPFDLMTDARQIGQHSAKKGRTIVRSQWMTDNWSFGGDGLEPDAPQYFQDEASLFRRFQGKA